MNSPAPDTPPDSATRHNPAWWQDWKVMLPLCIALAAWVWFGIQMGVDTRVIAGTVFVAGLLSNAFAWLLGIVALVPLVGPLIV